MYILVMFLYVVNFFVGLIFFMCIFNMYVFCFVVNMNSIKFLIVFS